MIDFLRKRINERSTAIKIVALISLFLGPSMAPEQREAILTLVGLLLGVGAAVPDGSIFKPKE